MLKLSTLLAGLVFLTLMISCVAYRTNVVMTSYKDVPEKGTECHNPMPKSDLVKAIDIIEKILSEYSFRRDLALEKSSQELPSMQGSDYKLIGVYAKYKKSMFEEYDVTLSVEIRKDDCEVRVGLQDLSGVMAGKFVKAVREKLSEELQQRFPEYQVRSTSGRTFTGMAP